MQVMLAFGELLEELLHIGLVHAGECADEILLDVMR